MGERRARWGYGYQDKIATERILNLLRENLREGEGLFEGVRLADLEAGRVDDFVLIWKTKVEGNSIKWSGEAIPINWGDLIGVKGLIKEVADGYQRLKRRWPDKTVLVRIQSNRPPSSEKHHAQLISTFSVAEFLRDHWQSGPSAHDSAELAEIWSKISDHSGLMATEFAEFVNSCNLCLGYPEPPGSGSDSQDWRHYKKQFDDLHKAIATWITNNPHSEFLDNYFLLSAIGVRGFRSGLIQKFPFPKIPYSKNEESAGKIKNLIDNTEGGYIAVVGPAGIGKSTLVQDILSDADYPFFIPYYAFLPDTDGNRDRGEALTFFQDVIGRFDKFFSYRYSLGIADIAQGREAFRIHMHKANEQYTLHGHKTILLIDGLDHVSREINLDKTLLQELPNPDEVPQGFLIILSTQPQALIPGTITPSIGNMLVPQSNRRIEVTGLSRPEVHEILARIDKTTTGSERDDLYTACLGNPLILTYLVNLFQGTFENTVKYTIELAGNYGGDIDRYYQEILSTLLQDAQKRQLLGLICRAAPTIPVEWLQEWPERILLENICVQTLAPFVQIDEGNLIFIHNSLIAFLKSETRSRLPEANLSADECEFYSILADRCGDRPCMHPLGRARILHLLRANRNNDLLSVLSSDWLRKAIEAFLPYALIRPLILSGLEAAWSLKKLGHVLRLILLDHELSQRTSRLEAGDLAEELLGLDKPELAVSQIRSAGRLLVKDNVALSFAINLWFYADDHNQPELKNKAQVLYLQARPVSLFYQNEPIDIWHHSEENLLLQAWSEAAPLFEDSQSIIPKITGLKFKNSEHGEKVDNKFEKASLLYAALLTVMTFESRIEKCELFLDEITSLGQKMWEFAALLILARRKPLYISLDTLAMAYGKFERDQDVDLAYAEFLYKQGYKEEAKDIVKNLIHIRCDSIRNDHSFGFSDISYTVTLRCLQELLGIPEGSVPETKDNGEEAYARIETTARKIGVLLATAKRNTNIPNLNNTMRSLLLFHNQAIAFSEFDWRNNYVVNQSKADIYLQIVKFAAALGKKGLESLRDVFIELVNGPVGPQFAPHHRRFFAEELFRNRILSKEKAVELGLSSRLDASDEDPMQRQEACFEIATFLHTVGEDTISAQWFKRAGEVSAGAGSDKDYHISDLAEWLSHSVGDDLDESKLSILEKFARAVEVAGGDGASEAASQELELILQLDPIRASRFTIELIDRGLLDLSQALEALIAGGEEAGASADLLVALYSKVLSLISPKNTSRAALAVLRRFPVEKRIAKAEEIMKSIRTNSLPSHRIEIARAIQDALRQEGFGEYTFTKGLKPGRDDASISRTLYRYPTGEIETIGQVAARLSNHENIGKWNPYPSENAEFDWWSAVKKAKIKDLSHLNDLLAAFPPPEYREVDLLDWKSEQLLEIGDYDDATLLAKKAIDEASDGSWHRWLDGAKKMIAYGALKRIDKDGSLSLALVEFGKDLSAGKLNSSYLLSDIIEVIGFLELDWPAEAVRWAIDDYLDHVLAANQDTYTPTFESLVQTSIDGSADEALCRILVHLLAFPVIDVGVAARQTLSQYISVGGSGLFPIIESEPCWDSVQLEHILVSLHSGSCFGNISLDRIRSWILNLNQNESITVRGIARRICDEQGWKWKEINNQAKRQVILLPQSLESPIGYQEARMLIGGDLATAFELYRPIFARLEKAGINGAELRSEFYRLYREVEKEYRWAEENYLKHWMKLVLARFWLSPRAIIGREVAMRVLGRRSLTGQAPPGAEKSYDFLYPIYDPKLEMYKPTERPVELSAMEWELWDEHGKAWLRGDKADSWSDYPERINGLYIIGERSCFIRPNWEWPREERHRGLIFGPCDSGQIHEYLSSSHELTFECYLQRFGQNDEQLIVFNSERRLVGPAYRWAAINSTFATQLGWHSSDDEPFEWFDAYENLMVKSVYWRDGWIWLEPPRFESLGEGWLVLATEQGVKTIREVSTEIELHLWVERYSQGEKPYEGKWHLTKTLN